MKRIIASTFAAVATRLRAASSRQFSLISGHTRQWGSTCFNPSCTRRAARAIKAGFLSRLSRIKKTRVTRGASQRESSNSNRELCAMTCEISQNVLPSLVKTSLRNWTVTIVPSPAEVLSQFQVDKRKRLLYFRSR